VPSTLEARSTLTDRYQTTVPETVRRVLGLNKRDKIQYEIRPGGEVVLTRAQAEPSDDPVIERFLSFLAQDLADHPERIQAVDARLARRVKALVRKVQIDLDQPLSPEGD